MKLQGYVVILVVSLLVELFNYSQKRYLSNFVILSVRIIILCVQGVMYLSYPLLGHLADVYLNRYRALKCSLVTIVVGQTGIIALSLINVCVRLYGSRVFEHEASFVIIIPGCITMIGIGLFEANVIQFGLDLLLEASTPELIKFIHWYYWSRSVGSLLLFYIGTGIINFAQVYFYYEVSELWDKVLPPASLTIACAIAIATLILFLVNRKHFYIQRAGLNPFKNIYKVLKYSWKHKVPEHRSAFTYWEEDIPPRIDLGKNKYGGPFTNEEVEDTKTFLRILPLLLCLYGYHLAGDGYSAPEQLQRTSCPSLPVLLLIVANPLHISTIVTVVGIPMYHFVFTRLFPWLKNILLLTKMWIGMYLSLVQVVVYIFVVVTTYWQHHSSYSIEPKNHSDSSYLNCFIIRSGFFNHSHCQRFYDPVDNTYLWFIIPQILNGLSSLLVSMTVFEFICAQAPRTTQGLLIGLWYATFSIKYLGVGILDNLITETRSWLISEGVMGFLVLVSLVLFSCVSKRYRYRQRDEIVNVQGMIEEIYERRMDQEEEYMQERRALYKN